MSTGDQTQYIRGKISQRGLERGAHFMEDGFDRWAESTAPARVGQMEKVGSEPMAENYGGAMTLRHAKKLHMRGGFIPIPDVVKRAIDEAKKLLTMWKGVSTWLNSLKQELEDEVIDNVKMPQDWRDLASDFVGVLDAIKGFQSVLDGVASFVGAGRGGSMHGGATTIESIGKVAAQIAYYYGWLVANGDNIRDLLKLNSLNTGPANNVGNTVLGYLDPILKAVGAGRGGKKCAKKHCMCEGGALPVLDINSGTMVTKPNANRKKGGRRMSCSSDEMGSRKVGGNKLMDASPQGQAQMMKAITGMGRKRGGAMLAPGPRLRPPTAAQQQAASDRDRKHKEMVMSGEYDRILAEKMAGRPSQVFGGAMLAPGPRLRPPTAAQQQAASDRDRKHKEMVMSGEYDRILAEKMAGRPSQVFGGRKGGRGMEPRSMMSFPESMGSGKSKLKVGGRKSARGEVVKKVMREQGLSLPQASKYVKEHGLY